ncbi:MAG: phage virion morphogenesis protein [Gammaproteobacteria bacterium HGW-Gammaproteobacteria-11]|nr:MAG: phage virion morphogenesis protein [Gammaproteobacteria bacterium HGW-Gammaproteobacteria-11]
MAGATLEFDNADALAVIRLAATAMGDPGPMLRNMGEYLLIAHDQRWASQTSPDGQPWAPLSPAYQRRKKKNADRILQLDGYLKNTLVYQLDDNDLLFGSNRIYAAIQHFGGTIDMPARSQQAYFRQGRDGSAGNRFTKKSRSNFAQWVTIGGYSIQIPARPWLGTSAADDDHLGNIALDYIRKAGFSASP